MIEPDDDRVRDIVGQPIEGLLAPPLVYVPGLGFRPAAGGVRLRTPVEIHQGGRSLKVTRLVSTSQGTELSLDLIGTDMPWQDVMRRVVTTLRDETGRRYESRSWSSTAVTTAGIRQTAELEPLTGDLPRVELIVTYESVTIATWLELEPLDSSSLAMHRALDAADRKHGVTIRVKGIAFAEAATVIDLEADPSGGIRWIRGIGALMGIRRGAAKLTLRDDRGRTTLESDPTVPPRVLTGRTDIAIFPAVANDATSFELEIEYVYAEEAEGEVTFAVPVVKPLELRFGAHQLRVLGSTIVAPDARLAQTPDPRRDQPCVRIDLDLGDWHDDRRLLQPGRVLVDSTDQGFRTTQTPRGGPTNAQQVESISVPLADPAAARSVTFRHPTVHLRGPWRLRFPRPT